MAQIVKFVNRSGERVSLYREDGSIFKILENVGWDRDPAGGSLRTPIISQHENPPPPQPEAVWIDRVDWIWEDCPDTHPYAPFKKITFLKGNEVRLKRRLFWKLPELEWPVVGFLFTSPKMKMIRERLDGDSSVLASIFLNGIPIRKSVSPLSRYAKYKRWFFIEQPAKKSSDKQMDNTEIIQFGKISRSSTELKRIDSLRVKEEERQKELLV